MAAVRIQAAFRRWKTRALFLRQRDRLALEREAGALNRMYDPVWGHRRPYDSSEALSASAQTRLMSAPAVIRR